MIWKPNLPKIFVKQVTTVNNNIRYEIVKTINVDISSETRIGHKLIQADLENFVKEYWGEVEIS